MKSKPQRHWRHPAFGAFTLVEVLLVIAAIAVIAGAGIYTVSNVRESTRETKLQSDVAVINQGVNAFVANGGTVPAEAAGFPDLETAVLTALKAEATAASAATHVGMTGSFIDRRIVPEWQSANEADSDALRARWSAAAGRFVTARDGGAGIRNFRLDDGLAAGAFAPAALAGNIHYASEDGWVWDYTDAAPEDPDAPGGAQGTDDPDTARSFLDPPTFNPAAAGYPMANYDLAVALDNPNSAAVSVLYYSLNDGAYVRYEGGTVSVAPDTLLKAFAAPIEPEWVRSGITSGVYSAFIQPILEWDILADYLNGMTYAEAGGAMIQAGSAEVTPGQLVLANSDEIPAEQQNSSNFTVFWTQDGTDPVTSPSASEVPSFSGGYEPLEIDLSLGGWGESMARDLVAVAVAINETLFMDSEPAAESIPLIQTPLPQPLINPPTGIRIANLPITIFPSPGTDHPVGTRIYYTVDGTDPGVNAQGNPVGGTLYEGVFQQAPVDGEMVQITARVYGPEQYAHWFEPSPATVAQYFSAGGELIGAVVNSATLNANSNFTGSIVLNQPVAGDFTMNSNSNILSGNLYVPGTPDVDLHQNAEIQGREFLFDGTEIIPATNTDPIIDLDGDPLPDDYTIRLNSNATVEGKIYRRVDLPIAVPELPGMPDLSGAPSHNLNSGEMTLAPGDYGILNANAGTKFIIGDPSATEPTVYNVEDFNLNSGSELEIVGPVILNVGTEISISSNTTIGEPDHPEWLQLNIHDGGLSLNSNAEAYTHVLAPKGNVIVNANSLLEGAVVADELIMNANSDLDAAPKASVGQ